MLDGLKKKFFGEQKLSDQDEMGHIKDVHSGRLEGQRDSIQSILDKLEEIDDFYAEQKNEIQSKFKTLQSKFEGPLKVLKKQASDDEVKMYGPQLKNLDNFIKKWTKKFEDLLKEYNQVIGEMQEQSNQLQTERRQELQGWQPELKTKLDDLTDRFKKLTPQDQSGMSSVGIYRHTQTSLKTLEDNYNIVVNAFKQDTIRQTDFKFAKSAKAEFDQLLPNLETRISLEEAVATPEEFVSIQTRLETAEQKIQRINNDLEKFADLSTQHGGATSIRKILGILNRALQRAQDEMSKAQQDPNRNIIFDLAVNNLNYEINANLKYLYYQTNQQVPEELFDTPPNPQKNPDISKADTQISDILSTNCLPQEVLTSIYQHFTGVFDKLNLGEKVKNTQQSVAASLHTLKKSCVLTGFFNKDNLTKLTADVKDKAVNLSQKINQKSKSNENLLNAKNFIISQTEKIIEILKEPFAVSKKEERANGNLTEKIADMGDQIEGLKSDFLKLTPEQQSAFRQANHGMDDQQLKRIYLNINNHYLGNGQVVILTGHEPYEYLVSVIDKFKTELEKFSSTSIEAESSTKIESPDFESCRKKIAYLTQRQEAFRQIQDNAALKNKSDLLTQLYFAIKKYNLDPSTENKDNLNTLIQDKFSNATEVQNYIDFFQQQIDNFEASLVAAGDQLKKGLMTKLEKDEDLLLPDLTILYKVLKWEGDDLSQQIAKLQQEIGADKQKA